VLSATQIPQGLRDIADDQLQLYKKRRCITVRNHLPDTSEVPIQNPLHWLRIPDVVCVFVDMKGSTQLSAGAHDNGTAGVYQLFTGTAVRYFAEFETPYIDVRGDGIFGLFDSDQVYRAIAAAISFKTFAQEVFVPAVKEATGLDVGCHIGIDQRTVLVRKVGLKRHSGRTDRQNEVWAGKPVNMASKLAAMGEHNQLIVSDRYYAKIMHERVRRSCGCPDGAKADLWSKIDVSADGRFDFDRAYVLTSCWCGTHGKEFCEAVLALDEA
jgi:class 3 adenylate cyclase